MNECILRMKGISKSFSGVKVLDDVEFNVRSGTVHSLMGENGAGKSTLIKIMTGAHQPDAGSLFWMGQPVSLNYPWKARQIGIAFIH